MVTVIMSIFHERKAQHVNGVLHWPFKITGLTKLPGGFNLIVSSRVTLVPQRSRVTDLMLSILLLSVASVGAANNWYVRPSSAGSNNGQDWNDAWSISGINWSSVQPGDTIWLAGGTYGTVLTIGASGTSGNQIYIERVRSTDSVPTAAAGWQSSFDSLVVIPNITDTQYSYITVDGRITYGIQIAMGNGGDGITLSSANNLNAVNFYNIEIKGPYSSTGSNIHGITGSSSTASYSNSSISNCWIHGICDAFYTYHWTNIYIDHCWIADIMADGNEHMDIAYNYPNGTVTWRYNIISNCPADGIFQEYGQGPIYFYGNRVINVFTSIIATKTPSEGGSSAFYGPFYIYNNVFFETGGSGYIGFDDSSANGAMYMTNNVWWNASIHTGGASDPVYHDYNAFNGTGGEAHGLNNIANSFVNSGGGDFHLLSTSQLINKGAALAAVTGQTLGTDPDGNTRGADGAWDIGAYEYTLQNTQEPVLSNIQYSATVNTATITWTTDQNANSIVNYGLTTSYGMSVTNSSLVISHSVTIPNLAEGTYYNFQVQSIDSTNSLNSSGNQMFNTINPAIVVGLHVVSP